MNDLTPQGQLPIYQRVVAVTALATSIAISTPKPAQAVPLRDLIFRGIQVIQLSNLSERQEHDLGEQIHRNLLNQGMRLHQGRTLNRYVNRIGQRLVEAGAKRRRVAYRFQVVDDSRINAFATMGGRVYVTTGLIRAADNEAQLASVIGHEIGHIDRKHLVKQIRKTMVAQGLTTAITGSNRSQVANIGVNLLVSRPQSRSDEYDADREGLRILRAADYATSAMPVFMRKLVSSRSTPTFLSTHPAVPDRIIRLENAIRSGPKNECDRNPDISSCGLSQSRHRQIVGRR
ncbi:M48 family metallopeptidase [Acaryochloris sp. IP29b_bin.137]|uniref:M48 family metallopeptidase n=1 Tax=Acaryochloris sp. IP29b_bin.137 TaxID=2969217 RepID=UPI002630F43F|nr:M48 family metallopeptidase [Acaryochloris sp. IP29b_bin.137]